MSVEMQIFYRAINHFVSVIYYACQIWLLSNVVDHKKQIAKTLFVYTIVYIMESIMTEISLPIGVKGTSEILCFIVLYRLLLTQKTTAVALHIVYYWFVCIMLQESIITFLYKMNHSTPWIDVGHGVQLGKARVVLASAILLMILTFIIKIILKSTLEMMDRKNTWFLVFAAYVFYCLGTVLRDLFFQYVEGVYLLLGLGLLAGIAVVGMILHLLFVHSLYLEQKQREEHFKMEALEKQYVYYQDKQKDEERVRAIYHDMKNHLLVLEHQIHSPETAEMVEQLQQEMESYADYAHTGNDFLDVIIKDKTRTAREKQIDFSAVINLQGLDFMEPLDISTIFGNGIDNAIEASEKLSKGERVVQVKAGRVQDFLSILMENNCQEESIQGKESARSAEKEQRKDRAQSVENVQSMETAWKKKHTSKRDNYLHGFGISNMRNAAEKYGGQLTVDCGDGKFTLKILIPIS